MQPKSLSQWVVVWSGVWVVTALVDSIIAYTIGILWHHPEHHIGAKILNDLAETPRVVGCAVIGYKCLQWQQARRGAELPAAQHCAASDASGLRVSFAKLGWLHGPLAQQSNGQAHLCQWLSVRETHGKIDPAVCYNDLMSLRPFGLCAGEFTIPDDFEVPLPEEIL